MGYSTTLYAVDLQSLRSAVGSRDARLVRRVFPAHERGQKNPTLGPRVMRNRNGNLLLNRRRVSFPELVAELRRPEWKGSYLYVYEVKGGRGGRWGRPGSFWSAVTGAMPRGQFQATWICYSVENLFRDFGGDWYWFRVGQAAAELVEGLVTRPDLGYQYGYGLERLCEALGTRLTTIGGRRGPMTALKLDTPLAEERSPVPLPKRNDFPVIVYLTAAEVRREAERLGGMDLSFPEEEGIEAERKALLRALRKAAQKRVGVVGFYY